jgi:hypothetical protein
VRLEGCRAVGEYFDASPLPAMSQDDSREARTARWEAASGGKGLPPCSLVATVQSLTCKFARKSHDVRKYKIIKWGL